MNIKKFEQSHLKEWNDFIANSRNGTFLLNRNYMDYHSDRFTDNSLMFYDDKNRLLAVLPANISDGVLYSHQGLTYGGLIVGNKVTQKITLDIFDAIKNYAVENNISKIIYKKIPYIYSKTPSDEDLYALFRCGASLIRRDSSTTILLENKIKFSEQRKRGIKKSKKENIVFSEEENLSDYFKLVAKVLESKHGAKPVHSIDEISRLKDCFTKNIRLFCSSLGDELLAGVLVYETDMVAHAQYISCSDEGKEIGALDFVFDELINNIYKDKKYFDFGISTENAGQYLNEGLISQKEGFGGRTITYDSYEIII